MSKRVEMTDETLIPPTPSEEAYRVDEDQGDVFTSNDPFVLFAQWLGLAREKEINDPNSMALASVDAAGNPDVRIVLLKDINEDGLTFFTHYTSAKGKQLNATGKTALAFHWKSIRRQVRFRGTVTQVPPEASDAYFASRARGAQLGAAVSRQSDAMTAPDAFSKALEEADRKTGEESIPRPNHWGGYLVTPLEIEFWVNRPYRLHDRLLFTRATNKSPWETSFLYP